MMVAGSGTSRGTGSGGRQRLAVIFGGESPEHEVSVVSARAILREADDARFELLPVGITRGGQWLTIEETQARLRRIEAGAVASLGDDPGRGVLATGDALAQLATADVVFPIVHGRNGEDGTLQGLLELANLPYVGSGVAASAAGMDKALMRAAFAAAGIPQPRYLVLRDSAVKRPSEEQVRAIGADLGFPCFVKPANGGSSLGVSKARSSEDLNAAIAEAGRYDRKVLVEEGITGREIECAVLGNTEPRPSPLGEIVPGEDFYTYEAKYADRGTELRVPAPLDPAVAARVQEYAIRAYQAIGCAGLARVDFFVTAEDEIRIIEVNTLPGFTPISMFPRLWEHAGIPYRVLITRLVEFAMERHAQEHARA